MTQALFHCQVLEYQTIEENQAVDNCEPPKLRVLIFGFFPFFKVTARLVLSSTIFEKNIPYNKILHLLLIFFIRPCGNKFRAGLMSGRLNMGIQGFLDECLGWD